MTLILDIKRNSLDDGPGIRTTVFFKGCPLDCAWCHNPESKSFKAQLAFDAKNCVGCKECESACPEHAIDHGRPEVIDRGACTLCFQCVDACPAGALKRLGEELSVTDVTVELEKDLAFFANSGGGLTLSGGEPTAPMDFCAELLTECRERGFGTLLETCGLFDFSRFEMQLAPHLDVVYFDVKLIDASEHRKWCGVDNAVILSNLRAMKELSGRIGFQVLPRVPLIPGVTDGENNLRGIAEYLRECGFDRVSLLPYNPTWPGKAATVGQTLAYAHDKFMSPEEIERCQSYFEGFKGVSS